MENVWHCLLKLNIPIYYDSATPLLVMYLRKMKTYPYKGLGTNTVYSIRIITGINPGVHWAVKVELGYHWGRTVNQLSSNQKYCDSSMSKVPRTCDRCTWFKGQWWEEGRNIEENLICWILKDNWELTRKSKKKEKPFHWQRVQRS